MNSQAQLTSVQSRWQFWIDCGGTFTDIVARRPDGELVPDTAAQSVCRASRTADAGIADHPSCHQYVPHQTSAGRTPRSGHRRDHAHPALRLRRQFVVRAFVRFKQALDSHQELARRLAQLEARTDARFKAVFDALRDLMTPVEPKKKRGIGFTAHIEK
jgi:hypothetical protein